MSDIKSYMDYYCFTAPNVHVITCPSWSRCVKASDVSGITSQLLPRCYSCYGPGTHCTEPSWCEFKGGVGFHKGWGRGVKIAKGAKERARDETSNEAVQSGETRQDDDDERTCPLSAPDGPDFQDEAHNTQRKMATQALIYSAE